MSSHKASLQSPITCLDLLKRKKDGKRFSVVTCYDSSFARLVARTDVDMVLVGDSLGNVMLGYDDTIKVTVGDILHHTAAVTRVLRRSLVVADMPFLSYQLSKKQALKNAGRLVQKGGAQAVKLEGGTEVCPQVESIVKAGIPVVGHLGLTPQSVHMLGGYKVQGKSLDAREKLKASALALQDAGAFALVLELVPASLAAEVTAMLRIPTIGIGAGPDCDAQVLVLHDLLGFDEDFSPKFLKKYANIAQIVTGALREFDTEVKSGKFPTLDHSFSD